MAFAVINKIRIPANTVYNAVSMPDYGVKPCKGI